VEDLLKKESKFRVMQVSPYDVWSGAERIAWLLFKGLKARGLQSSMAVGNKTGNDPDIVVIPNRENYSGIRQVAWRLQQALIYHRKAFRGSYRLSRLVRVVVEMGSVRDSYLGREDYRYPGIWNLSQFVEEPDVINLHNLHGGYFDLRALPPISHRVPTVITLHDFWMLTGLCFYPMECERWRTGCGNCPQRHTRPSIIPSHLRRDGTANNWKEKRDFYAKSRLFVVCPSQWLMDKAKQSILAASIIGAKVIPNGIDLSVYRPGDRSQARQILGIADGRKVFLVVGAAILRNPIKGFSTIKDAMVRLAASHTGSTLLLLVIGARAQDEQYSGLEIRYVPYSKNDLEIARFYQAADVYIHGAIEDNFPTTILEAIACGTPVISTAAGGIPEQLKPLMAPGVSTYGISDNVKFCSHNEATGIFVPIGDSTAMSTALGWLLANDKIREAIGANAATDASHRFALDRQLDDYLQVYESMTVGRLSDSLKQH
jgi:glycosyltransferase involved in cell wall biosynthesis